MISSSSSTTPGSESSRESSIPRIISSKETALPYEALKASCQIFSSSTRDVGRDRVVNYGEESLKDGILLDPRILKKETS
jgi:hypothetical protein